MLIGGNRFQVNNARHQISSSSSSITTTTTVPAAFQVLISHGVKSRATILSSYLLDVGRCNEK